MNAVKPCIHRILIDHRKTVATSDRESVISNFSDDYAADLGLISHTLSTINVNKVPFMIRKQFIS